MSEETVETGWSALLRDARGAKWRVALAGRRLLPPIGELPFFITLPGYGFYWFLLAQEAQAPAWHEAYAQPLPEFVTLVVPEGWKSLLSGPARQTLETRVLPDFIAHQRWFAGKDAGIAATRVLRASEVGLLRTDDIDFRALRIMVHRLKGSHSGAHPMQPDEVKVLRAYLRGQPSPPSPILFASNRGDPIARRTLDWLMKRYGEAADVPRVAIPRTGALNARCGELAGIDPAIRSDIQISSAACAVSIRARNANRPAPMRQ